jgi:hypothetical protein
MIIVIDIRYEVGCDQKAGGAGKKLFVAKVCSLTSLVTTLKRNL